MTGFDEAYAASLGYFKGDAIAAQKYLSKYALQGPSGDIEEPTPDLMHRRLAREFARIELTYPNPMSEDEIFGLLDGFRYVVPQGGPMSGIGNPYQVQTLSNCFVVPSPHDSYGGILRTDQEQVQIMKRRGGVGFDISTIRPKGLPTANAARTTDGIEVFMERWSNSCREVAQGGRRGALMLSLSCHHSQVRDFINIKRDLKKVTGANISIRLSDEFMRAVSDGTQVQLRFPVERDVPHIVEEMVDARALWDEMVRGAHDYAEPGLLFWDTIVDRSPADIYAAEGFRSISTNPCAEIPMGPDACRLMLVNLVSFVKRQFQSDASWDRAGFIDVVMRAQRLMDDMVDLEVECIDRIIAKVRSDPEPENVRSIEIEMWERFRLMALQGRRTGLGVTAVGDAIAMLGMKYGSDESITFIESVYRDLALATYMSSAVLARERGAFPIHDYARERKHPFLRQLFDASPELERLVKRYGRRNIACNTTAPAGTVSLMTQTTSGIEPAFLLSYVRRSKVTASDRNATVDFVDGMGDRWQEFQVFHHGFRQWMDATGHGPDDIKLSPYWGATSADIDWGARVRLQAAAQRWVDHAISSTINLPEDTPIEVTKRIYAAGWEAGCKGITVYRAGSRSGVLVEKKDEGKEGLFGQSHAPKRPDELPCRIHHTQIKNETWTILIGLLEGRPYEVFGGLSRYVEIPKKYDEGVIIKRSKKTAPSTYDLRISNGSDLVLKDVVDQFDNPNYSAMTRIISLALRHGTDVTYVVEQLQKDRDSDMFSFAKCIARVLKTYIRDGNHVSGIKRCGGCGSTNLRYQEGCPSCLDCLWSRCQ